MTMLKEKLTEAINAKNNDVNSFVWKFARNRDGSQDEIKLMDATSEQLKQFYDHCNSMLYSNNKNNPGRYVLLDIIKDQRDKCNVEIYLRKLNDGSLTNGEKYPRHLYWQDVNNCIKQNKETLPQSKLAELPISMVTGGLPLEFARLSIALVRDACLDCLNNFDNKHITFNFIRHLGIYLTNDEMKEFNELAGKTRTRMEVIKERLNIRPDIDLIIKPSGLSFSEFRSMLNLRPKKYSELTTDQLVTLRNKVLFRLEQDVIKHISFWEDTMKKIEQVAKVREISLN